MLQKDAEKVKKHKGALVFLFAKVVEITLFYTISLALPLSFFILSLLLPKFLFFEPN